MPRPATLINCPQMPHEDNVRRPWLFVEWRIVWNLILALRAAGFTPCRVEDGDDEDVIINPADGALASVAAMEAATAVDEATIHFRRPSGGTGWIFVVFGNEVDVLSNWSTGCADFAATVSAFEPEHYL